MNYKYFDEIDSTQKYLLGNFKNFNLPVCVWSENQTSGIGSRGNKWEGKKGNLFFSFAYPLDYFKNVPLQSFSIYFGWILKEVLNFYGSKAVLKWPNDIYLIEKEIKKIGGIITNIKNNILICGIGLNTKYAPSDDFGCLDIKIKNDKILEEFFNRVEKREDFSKIISKYKKEFEKTKKIFGFEGTLSSDGAIIKNNKKVYSKR
jgi:BirA family biotin operon repressor/biotin-[acetyl-CoA-carboxylase] ligase